MKPTGIRLRTRLGGDDLPVVFESLLPAIEDSEEPALFTGRFKIIADYVDLSHMRL
jgi:hypothetical protein